MRKIKYLLLLLLCIIPIQVNAIKTDYEDKLYDVVDVVKEENKINLYLFRGEGCPHCKNEEKWLKQIKEKYGDYLNVYDFEVWYNEENQGKYIKATERMEINTNIHI